MIHRLMQTETLRYWEDEPPAIDPKRVPRRARTRVKKAEKTLRKFGVWPRRKFERTKYVEFDSDSLLRGCVKNIRDVIHRTGCRDVRVLVGPDQFPRLRDEMADHWFSFPVPADTFGGLKIDGCVVQFIPWMRGVLVVPEPDGRAA